MAAELPKESDGGTGGMTEGAEEISGRPPVFRMGAREELKTRGGSLSSEGANAAVQAERSTPIKVLRSLEYSYALISPTHKRTEGRAPVWGSEFTSKRRRTTGGGYSRIRCRLNVKLRTSVVRDWCVFFYPFSSPNPFSNLFGPSRTILNLRPKNLSEI